MTSDLIHVSSTAQSTASAEAVFAVIADGSTWPHWSAIKTFTLQTPGADGAEGVGAVRRWNSGLMTTIEQVVEVEAPTKFAYTLLESKLVLVRDYRADVVITPTATGCSVQWSSEFRPKVPGTGWFWRIALGKLGASLASGAAEYAQTLAK
ncbi:MAG: SRPBCC family protein [Candidatus Nanopelagicales bacterium]|nr:SRPBCC family protein [Candidatus Nanopelagicales bacterium]